MKTIRMKLYKSIIVVFFAVAFPAFIAGWVVAVNFSGVFETGYKMAFLDIRSAIKESVKDGQQYFYMNGIKISAENFAEHSDFTAAKVIKNKPNARKRELQ